MRGVADHEPIYEEHECCAVCGGTVNLGLFDDEISVCGGCYKGGRFQTWLENEIEKALEESPDFERLRSGGFRRVNKSANMER
jgi:hypothetical protein